MQSIQFFPETFRVIVVRKKIEMEVTFCEFIAPLSALRKALIINHQV